MAVVSRIINRLNSRDESQMTFYFQLLLLFSSNAYSALNQNSCAEVARVTTNGFKTNRSFSEYDKEAFDGKLKPILAAVSDGGHWVDMGAGSGRAQVTYLRQNKKSKLRANRS